jgi:hypothetical protein
MYVHVHVCVGLILIYTDYKYLVFMEIPLPSLTLPEKTSIDIRFVLPQGY